MSEPIFTQTGSAFSMHCSVEINIRANVELLWSILMDAKDYPRWNSTVASIEGQVKEGQELKVRTTATDRVFRPVVSGIVHNEQMIWSEGSAPFFKGVRTFTMKPHGDGTSDFKMEEHLSGLVFALTKFSLPDFRALFVAYAQDLKREAEREGSQSFLRHQ